MNSVDETLYRTRKTIAQACSELLIDYTPEIYTTLGQCAACNIWLKKSQLFPDLDGAPICGTCMDFYGP